MGKQQQKGVVCFFFKCAREGMGGKLLVGDGAGGRAQDVVLVVMSKRGSEVVGGWARESLENWAVHGTRHAC